MPITEIEVKELKKHLSEAKGHVLNFGLCIAAPPEDTVILLSKTKDGKALATKAKDSAERGKMFHGTCTVESSVLILTCTARAPTSLAKTLKTLFREHKITNTVKVTEVVED